MVRVTVFSLPAMLIELSMIIEIAVGLASVGSVGSSQSYSSLEGMVSRVDRQISRGGWADVD